jgi:hypothetical protein
MFHYKCNYYYSAVLHILVLIVDLMAQSKLDFPSGLQNVSCLHNAVLWHIIFAFLPGTVLFIQNHRKKLSRINEI